MLLPALARAKAKAQKTLCTSNGKQWGLAVNMYAGDNQNQFPDNTTADGAHDFAWMAGHLNLTFFQQYIYRNQAGTSISTERSLQDVIYCPTDQFHRAYEATYGSTTNLIGYNYLPGRQGSGGYNGDVYGSPDVSNWMLRTKLNGSYRLAPIMADKLQSNTGNPANQQWTTTVGVLQVPGSNHPGKNNVPSGANFLYEDGSVSWHKFDAGNYSGTIKDSGTSQYQGWIEFFHPAELAAGPW
jgi:hypothetical protein